MSPNTPDLAPYRKFRHVVLHGYGFQLDWERMTEGIEHVNVIYQRLKTRFEKFLESCFQALVNNIHMLNTLCHAFPVQLKSVTVKNHMSKFSVWRQVGSIRGHSQYCPA